MIDPARQTDMIEVRSPYDDEVVGAVPATAASDIEAVVEAAAGAATTMAAMPAYQRAELLHRAADIVHEREAELARTITAEEGKAIWEARVEAARTPPLLHLAAEEALRIHGDVLPMDASEIGVGRLGFTQRMPVGIVLAITPFNFPSRLVAFKVGPALASGNAVIVKPASATPLTARFLVQALLDAGLPAGAAQVVHGPGASLGAALVADHRIRKISFTGSAAAGEQVAHVAGLKRLTAELGSNVAVVILDDADLDHAADALAADGYFNAGQVCISAQRVITTPVVHDALVERLTSRVAELRTGDPAADSTNVGTLIDSEQATRVTEWLSEAEQGGARILIGGGREKSVIEPAVVDGTPLSSRLWRDELFGPAVAIHTAGDPDAALAAANDTRYGLAASVFTRDLERALTFVDGLHVGNVNVNGGPNYRVDFMPYGGVGSSGFGKEGVKYSIAEMTDEKMVIIHRRDPLQEND